MNSCFSGEECICPLIQSLSQIATKPTFSSPVSRLDSTTTNSRANRFDVDDLYEICEPGRLQKHLSKQIVFDEIFHFPQLVYNAMRLRRMIPSS